MPTHTAERHGPEEHGGSDRNLARAVVVMLVSLAILFGVIVPIAIYLLHRASGY